VTPILQLEIRGTASLKCMSEIQNGFTSDGIAREQRRVVDAALDYRTKLIDQESRHLDGSKISRVTLIFLRMVLLTAVNDAAPVIKRKRARNCSHVIHLRYIST